MSRQRIEKTATTTAGAATVYALLRDGSEIRWVAAFDPRFPGTGRLVRRGLKKFIAENVNGLAAYAARR